MDAPAAARPARRECRICWYVYDPALGDPVWQVEPGTPFEALPAHWSCPNCAGLREVRNLFFSSDDEIMTHHFPVYAPFIVVGGDPDRGRDRPVADLFARLRGTVRSIPFGTF